MRLLCVLLAMGAGGWLGVRTSHPAKVTLDAGPAVEGFDLPVHVEVRGLVAGERVVVQGLAHDDDGRSWRSWAQFTADNSGAVDLARAVPERGTYAIADAAGLIWSLQPTFTPGMYAQYIVPDGAGFDVQVQVIVGGAVVAEQTLTRSVPQASRELTVAQAGFDGSLFLPADVAPQTPAVVVIGGSGGGEDLLETAGLAADGYPTLALAYFGEAGLPSCLCSIPLEYFAHAVAWLRAQPGFATRPLVLTGASRGGEGALLIASYEPTLFDAVIANSPSDSVNSPYGAGYTKAPSAWTFGGQALALGLIPVPRIRVPLLVTAGGSDVIWDSAGSAADVMRELDATPGSPSHTYLYYPGAGHGAAGSTPYFPFNPIGYGGSQVANELAAVDSWARELAFIGAARRHLAPAG